jgi:hypothetical protein
MLFPIVGEDLQKKANAALDGHEHVLWLASPNGLLERISKFTDHNIGHKCSNYRVIPTVAKLLNNRIMTFNTSRIDDDGWRIF